MSGLESQVSSLESERARLSDLIEAQKRDAAAAEDVANKRLEDALKESQQLVCINQLASAAFLTS